MFNSSDRKCSDWARNLKKAASNGKTILFFSGQVGKS